MHQVKLSYLANLVVLEIKGIFPHYKKLHLLTRRTFFSLSVSIDITTVFFAPQIHYHSRPDLDKVWRDFYGGNREKRVSKADFTMVRPRVRCCPFFLLGGITPSALNKKIQKDTAGYPQFLILEAFHETSYFL